MTEGGGDPPPAPATGAPKPAPKLKIRAPTPSVSTATATTRPSTSTVTGSAAAEAAASASAAVTAAGGTSTSTGSAAAAAVAAAQGPSPKQGIPSPRPPSGTRPERYDGENESETDKEPTLLPGNGATPYLRLLHQRTELSLAYQDGCWAYGGETTLWLVDEGTYGSDASSGPGGGGGKVPPPAAAAGGTSSTNPAKSGAAAVPSTPPQKRRELALHLRGGCRVESVNVESCIVTSETVTTTAASGAVATTGATSAADTGEANTEAAKAGETPAASTATATSTPAVTTSASMQPIPSDFFHFDPLQTVLRKPASSYTADEFEAEMMEAARDGGGGGGGDALLGDDGPGIRKGRCHADTQCARGGSGMMDALRLASAASRNGELRILVGDTSPADFGQEKEAKRTPSPSAEIAAAARKSASDVWAASLNRLTVLRSGPPSMPGRIVRRLRTRLSDRCEKRRDGRIKLISDRMASMTVTSTDILASATDGGEVKDMFVPSALKVTVRFLLPSLPPGLSHHAGGIHFVAPAISVSINGQDATSATTATSPHVYTTVGIHGDHEGPRSWLPTLDSASSKHRASHELTVKMTAREEEGLWSAGFGEDFGCGEGVGHCVFPPRSCLDAPESGAIDAGQAPVVDGESSGADISATRHQSIGKRVREALSKALGTRHVDFCIKFFHGLPSPRPISLSDGVNMPHIIPLDVNEEPHQSHRLVTSLWTTASWSPIPARSLGFATGPFRALYDPEYYTHEDDDDEEEEEDADVKKRSVAGHRGGDNDGDVDASSRSGGRSGPPTVEELAMVRAEGIRQLYFAIKSERKDIYFNAPDIAGLAELFDEVLGPDSDLGSSGTNSGILSAFASYHFHCQRRSRMPSHTPTRPALLQQRLDIETAIIRSTSGVPNRALSLMRDVLALPSYRSSSHTQIWIPGAVAGGTTSGSLNDCPETCGSNPFLGGVVFDSALLPPPGHRLPFHCGGRVLQLAQARAAIRGWIVAALPLGSQDDIGQGYLHCLIESVLMGLYEKGHGAWGEGGARGSYYFSPRFAIGSGLNSPSLDFLPLSNVDEDADGGMLGGGVAAVPTEDKGHLWRSIANGTESHTGSLDEYSLRHLLMRDVLDYLERQDQDVPLPSNNWLGSRLSATFLSSNSTSSSAIGCGALELVHPVGGVVFRHLKTEVLRRVVEGRAGLNNLVRVIRAAFAAALLEDAGEAKLTLPQEEDKKRKKKKKPLHSGTSDATAASSAEGPATPAAALSAAAAAQDYVRPMPPYATCVDELIKKGGLTHMTFARALRILSGPVREPYLRGSLIDVDRDVSNKFGQSTRQLVEPESFPNSFVRGASSLYLRVGVHVEPAGGGGASDTAGGGSGPLSMKGTSLVVFVEPVVPLGGINYGGLITIRVIENEGQCREFVKTVPVDGSRADWGPIFLHAKPVTTQKQQTAASGTIEGGASGPKSPAAASGAAGGGSSASGGTDPTEGSARAALPSQSIFTPDTMLHSMGYQAIELIRLTNRTPLLWVSIDPHFMYDGRVSIFQPDSCLAEKLFHDGEAISQVESIRALAERPHRIQGSVQVKTIFDVDVAELPVRVLGDCLRGSATLQRDLPHTPAVRVQAALAIAQWQNNKAPDSIDIVGGDVWVGLDLLLQYFKERWVNGDTVMPVHYTRTVCKTAKNKNLGGENVGDERSAMGDYIYLDSMTEPSERASMIEVAEAVQFEEDEEYRVRSAVITAIASIRAKDGRTPPAVVRFLTKILSSGDGSISGNIIPPNEDSLVRKKRLRRSIDQEEKGDDDQADGSDWTEDLMDAPYVSATSLADSLLALCHVNIRPAQLDDPAVGGPGTTSTPSSQHPILPLMALCHRWLEWDLYREDVRLEAEADTMTGVGSGCYSTVSACAITALVSLALLRQSTSDAGPTEVPAAEDIKHNASSGSPSKRKIHDDDNHHTKAEQASTAKYYAEIFDSRPVRADATRAAAAQAVTCICCAADRLNDQSTDSLGLLTALEFLLDRIQEPTTSPGLRQSLVALMFDACTGKVCSMQRAAIVGGRNDLCSSSSRFTQGPLGASHGGDNGSAFLLSVAEETYPAANAVNDGARQGLRTMKMAGRDQASSDVTVVRVARFATTLWRTINGETSNTNARKSSGPGVCSQDGQLRCSLLSLWQWIWSKTCIAVLRVQSWDGIAGTKRYLELGADKVMKFTAEEKEALKEEENACTGLKTIADSEIDRQRWRGEMSKRSYEFHKSEKAAAPNVAVETLTSTSQDLGKPLPLVAKDAAWRSGGWVASTAQQRRAKGLDGGSAITKIRLTVAKT